MTCDLYYAPMSSPCRAVMLTAEAIGLNLNYKLINTMADEQLESDFDKINSIKTIPILVDGDYKLSEGPAIMCYLVDMYGGNTQLYPKNTNDRALVHQRLHFDIGTLYKAVSLYYYPVVLREKAEYNEAKYEKLKDRFATLDKYLEGHDYATGRNLTIADLALIASVTTAQAFGFEVEPYTNVSEWAERVKSSARGYRSANVEGVEMLKKFIAETVDE